MASRTPDTPLTTRAAVTLLLGACAGAAAGLPAALAVRDDRLAPGQVAHVIQNFSHNDQRRSDFTPGPHRARRGVFGRLPDVGDEGRV
ncbi:hypothetical protein [Actinosynnema sp. NPDC020468]|uniref:hypothetical protein n=1 Tax=Actinosynnema sp. NPDC020468 TaxID=3154488 RepID=UPI0033D525B2